MTTPGFRGAARFVSVAGHPAVVMPGAMLAFASRSGFTPASLVPLAVALAIAAALMAWGRGKVRHGGWRHIDASHPRERREWNRTTFVVLAIGALSAAAAHVPILALGLGCCAVILAVAIGTGGRLKLSQHVAFAALAACVAGPTGMAGGLAAVASIIAIGWSRVTLGRHTTGEAVAGAAIGLLAGLGFAAGAALLR